MRINSVMADRALPRDLAASLIRNLKRRGVDYADVRLERLLLEYKRSRQAGEQFNDFCSRLGDRAIAQLLAAESPPCA